MAGLCALILVAVGAAGPCGAGRQDLSEVRRLREEGRYGDAIAACEGIDDPVVAAEARLDVTWRAGDLGGALGHGLEGLRSAPQGLNLLWSTTRLATDLSAGELADELWGRLSAAVQSSQGLDATTRGPWVQALTDLRPPIEELLESAGARDRALVRARVTVVGAGIGLLALMFLLGRRP